MRKQLLLLLATTFFCLNAYSQITFEKGYYIDNNDHKIDCLIRNNDWKNNPTEFEYKLTKDAAPSKATIRFVKEFGIDNVSKYIRGYVDMDRSSENLREISKDKDPIFNREELFLKVLVEGRATLYQYTEGILLRFFYNTGNADIKQLIFKSYKTPQHKVGKNNGFRQQLWDDLKCADLRLDEIRGLNYKKNELVHFFVAYNNCSNLPYVNFEEKQKRGDWFGLTIRPRLNRSSLTLQNNSSSFNFENKTAFGLGIEAEFTLPYNKNKWAIAIEPTYQNFKAETTTNNSNVSGGELITNIDYSSIEVPVTLRHYFFLRNSKIFVNASYVFDINSKTTIDFTRNDGSSYNSLDLDTRNNMAIGIGYKQSDRYSLELRYHSNREILGNYLIWSSAYKTLSVIFGYSPF